MFFKEGFLVNPSFILCVALIFCLPFVVLGEVFDGLGQIFLEGFASLNFWVFVDLCHIEWFWTLFLCLLCWIQFVWFQMEEIFKTNHVLQKGGKKKGFL